MNLFDKINHYIEGAEGSIITLVTTLIPWLAPALPAWLTWYHLTTILSIPPVIAVTMALTVEFLGLSAVSTAFSYMRHNKVNRVQKNHVSLAFPVGAYLFYLLVIVTVNVVQEIPMNENQQQMSRIVSIALLTLISAPVFIIAIARDQQRKIESEITTAKHDKEIVNKLPQNDSLSDMTIIDIMRQYGVSERTAYRHKAKARNNGNGK